MLIKEDPAVIAGYLEDASGLTTGRAERLVIPDHAGEIAEYLAAASSRHEPVTLAGGRTGVAAGCIPRSGTLLSLERLNTLGPIQATDQGAEIHAGPAVTLETLKALAEKARLVYGPDPTERSGTLGGNASTNASGGQGFQYGTTRDHIVGLQAVLATGETVSLRRGQHRAQGDWLRLPLDNGRVLEFDRPQLPRLGVRKNAAGYFSQPNMDPIDLLIGSEGTLAVLTQITVRLLPAPDGVFSLAIFFPDTEQAAALAATIRQSADGRKPLPGLRPASLEFMDHQALHLLRPRFPSIPKEAGAVLMMDQEYAAHEESAKLEAWSTFLSSQAIPESFIWLASDRAARHRLREFRHALPETVNTLVRQRRFPKVGTDMAVPEPAFPGMLALYQRELAASGMDYLIFGHIGECHLHVNVLPRTEAEYRSAKNLYRAFAQAAVEQGGTVSAEHGIGKLKHDFLTLMVGETGLREMIRIKRIFDPALILNRDTVFPERLLADPAC